MSDNEDVEIEEVEQIDDDSCEIVDAEAEPEIEGDEEGAEAEEPAEEEEEEEEAHASVSFDSCANDSELTAASLAARDWLRYGETIVQCEIVLEMGHKKKGVFGKKTVNVERVLVIGKHHIWVLSRSSGKKKCQVLAEFHFFGIRSVKHNADACRITFALRSNAPKETTLDYQYTANSSIFSSIVECVKQITYGFPDNHLNITSTAPMPEPELPETDEYEKVVSNYYAQCSFMKVPINNQLLEYVKNQINNDSHDLDLTSVPVIMKESSERVGSTVQFLPLLSALAYNTRFYSLDVSGCQSAHAMRYIARYVLHNTTLTKLVARNVTSSDEGMSQFWDHLAHNTESALQLIDFSGTTFGQQSIVACARMLMDWEHPISELILADCGINGKMLQTFFSALNKNPAMSISIQHLDLSGNKFEVAGTQALDSWFATLKVYCQVKKLILRNTGVSFGSLRSFIHVTDIEEIDLSGNKMDTAAVRSLSSLVKNSTTLKSVVLDNCSLSAESLSELCTCMMCQKGPMSFSIANNGDISKGLGRDFSACSERIVEFNFSGARMREQHFNELLSQLSAFKGLRKLILNNSVEKLKATQSAVNSLSAIIGNGLQELSLADTIGKAGICALFAKIPKDCALEKIDVSDNQLGDDGVTAVCAWLREATNLHSINVDNNRVTINGILNLTTVFSVNNVITELCIENDFMHEVNATTGLPRKRLMQAMTRMILSSHAQDKEEVFWMNNSESPMILPTPTQQNALPPAPSYFSERKASIVEPPPALPGGLTTMQIDSLEVEPVPRERKPATRTPQHRPIIASRVQNTSSSSVASPSQPPTLNAPPSLAVPPSLNAPPSLKAPPMLSVPGQPAAAPAAAPEPAPRAAPSAGPARRAGVAKRAAVARRPGASSAPKAAPRSTGHSRNFEPTVELQRDIEAEEAGPAESPRADEPDPDMPALQPVAPAPPTRQLPKPQREAPQLNKPAPPPRRSLPQPEEEEPAEEEPAEVEPQSPQTPTTPTRRMLIGNRGQRPAPPPRS